MGKGTIIADGQGNEKLFVFEDIIYDNSVKCAAGVIISDFDIRGSKTLVNGNVHDAEWNKDNAKVEINDSARKRAKGDINAGSTTFTVSDPLDTEWSRNDVISIETEGDVGDNNGNYGGQSGIYAAPVEKNGSSATIVSGWLSENERES